MTVALCALLWASTPAGPQVLSAGTEGLRADDGAYRLARIRLWAGYPKRALTGVDSDATLFPDRMALVEGQSLERLGKAVEAKEAYQVALRASQAQGVTLEAQAGLVRVLGRLGEWPARMKHLDALIAAAPDDEPAYELMIERAVTHTKLGRVEEGKAALWRLIEAYPGPRIADAAETELLRIENRRRLSRLEQNAKEIARLRWISAGSAYRGLRALRRAPAMVRADPEVMLLEADLWARRGRRAQSRSLLQALQRRHPCMAPAVALRMARLARDQYQYRQARQAFELVQRTHPGTPEAVHAAYEGAEMEFDADEYAAAAHKAKRFIQDHPSSHLLARAEWLGGFSAFIANDRTMAAAIFDEALQREERPRLRYWLGRARGDATSFRKLVEEQPLTYYGLMAARRLEERGVDMSLEPLPPVPAPESVEAAITLLGPDRPLGVDRAAALFGSRLRREGTEELLSLADHFRQKGDTHGATLVVDLLQLFDKDAWVFLLSRRIAEGDPAQDLVRRPYYWRIWRYAFPTPFEEEVAAASADHQVDRHLIYAVMRTESLFRPHAVSPVGARGLMQVMPRTARWIGRRDRRAKPHARQYRKPRSNIWLGTWYLRHLLDQQENDPSKVLAAYNAGPAAVSRWRRRFVGLERDTFIERIPYDETRRYVRRALQSYEVYRRLDPEVKVAAGVETSADSSG